MSLEKITKMLLAVTLAIPPFIMASSLIFPFISGKVYLFRLLVAICFLSWTALAIKEPKYRPNFKNLLVISVFLLLIALIITGFLGIDPVRSFFSDFERGKGVIQFAFWVLYFVMLTSVLRTNKDWKIFLGIFLVVAFLISAYGWYKHQQPTLNGTFGNPSYLAGLLIFAVGFTAVFLERKFFSERIWQKLGLLILGLFFMVSLIFTGCRGAYAGLGAGFILLTIFSIVFLRKERKKLAIGLSFILIMGIVFLGIIFVNKESQFVQSHRMLKRSTGIVEVWQSSSFKERLLTWKIALKTFKDKPVFGWGMENFQTAFNKHYDYRIGLEEPWFDRVHNQALEYLTNGGLFLFSFYLFWIFSFFYLIYKIFKKRKLLGVILGSIFTGYLVQGLFLFDTFSLYMGLFTLLGFGYFQYRSIYSPQYLSLPEQEGEKERTKIPIKNKWILVGTFCLVVFLIYFTAWIPYKVNALGLKYYVSVEQGKLGQAREFLEQACKSNSPFAYFSVRKRAGWEFVRFLDYAEKVENPDSAFVDFYKFITSELEKARDYRPVDPQIYFLLGRIYQLGYEKLGQDDLGKAERVLKESFNYSKYRIEYFNELGKVFLLQGKFEEAERLIKDYTERIGPELAFSHVTLGHFYFVTEKYELAMEEYQKAKNKGYDFLKIPNLEEYNRYLATAEKVKDYEKIVEICLVHLERYGPTPKTFFNLAISYKELGEDQKAKEFFERAIKLNKDYEKYRGWFEIP